MSQLLSVPSKTHIVCVSVFVFMCLLFIVCSSLISDLPFHYNYDFLNFYNVDGEWFITRLHQSFDFNTSVFSQTLLLYFKLSQQDKRLLSSDRLYTVVSRNVYYPRIVYRHLTE